MTGGIMTNVEKLQAVIDEQVKNEGLINVRLMPNCDGTKEEIAGNVLAMLNAEIVEDEEIF
jgi:RNA-binding protein YhbY